MNLHLFYTYSIYIYTYVCVYIGNPFVLYILYIYTHMCVFLLEIWVRNMDNYLAQVKEQMKELLAQVEFGLQRKQMGLPDS